MKTLTKRNLLSLLAILILFFSGTLLHAQTKTVIAFVQEDGVYLRWKADRSATAQGYTIYRKQGDTEDWMKLTPEPLQRISKVSDLRNALGYQTEMFLNLFRCDNPPRDIDDTSYRKVVEDKNSDSFLSLISAANAKIATALGEMFIDRTANKRIPTAYRVVLNASRGEQVIGETEVLNPGALMSVPTVQGLTGIPASNSVTLDWKRDNEMFTDGSVTTYNVYRSDALLGDYMQMNTSAILPITISADAKTNTPTEHETYTDRYLEHGKNYYYYVTSVNAFGIESSPSPTIEAIPHDTTIHAAPSGVRATILGASVLIEWDGSESSHSLRYEVYKSKSEKGQFEKIVMNVVRKTDAVPSYVDTEVSEGEAQYYFVKAISSDGATSDRSDIVSIFSPDITPPSKLTGVTVKAERGKITLTWRANTEPDLQGYHVERASDTEFATRFLLTEKPVNRATFIDTIAPAVQSTFGYVVYAVDKNDNSSQPSEMVCVKTFDKIPPQTPFITSAKISDGEVQLEWTKNAEEDFESYGLYRSEKDSLYFRKITSTKETVYKEKPTGIGMWFYSVTSIDSLGNESIRSRAVSLRHEDVKPPLPPAKGNAVVRNHDIIVSWEKSASLSIAAYQVIRKKVSNNSLVQLGEVKPEKPEFIDANANPEKEYVYLIRARDAYWRYSEAVEVRYKP